MAREMKDSGNARVGSIPIHWKIGRLKHVAQLYTGNSIKDDEKELYGDPIDAIPYISSKDIDATFLTANYSNGMYVKKNDLTFKIAPAGSLLMCIEGGSAGRKKTRLSQSVAFVNKLCCFNPAKINGDFLYYWICSPNFEDEFKENISGLIGGVSVSSLQNFTIALPSSTEQMRIASFLDRKCAEIDSVIADTQRTIEEYKKLKQSVITQAVTKGVRGERPMKDSGIEWIGEIPEEWNTVGLKFLCSMQSGKNITSEMIADEGAYPVYGGNGLRGYYSEYNTEGEYLLVGRQGALCGNVHHVSGQFWATEHAVVTTPTALANIDFLHYLLIGMNLNQYANNTAAQPGLAVGQIQNVRTCFVPLAEQQEIASYLNKKCAEIDNLIAAKTHLLGEIEAYKKSIIYEYVTGKKEVPACQ